MINRTRAGLYINALTWEERKWISSQELAARTGICPTQIRRDFMEFGHIGKRGVGYRVDELLRRLAPSPAKVAVFAGSHEREATLRTLLRHLPHANVRDLVSEAEVVLCDRTPDPERLDDWAAAGVKRIVWTATQPLADDRFEITYANPIAATAGALLP